MNTYKTHGWYNHIADYKAPKDLENWRACPDCSLKPQVWVYDNGMTAACGCWDTTYDKHEVKAECVNSLTKRGKIEEYNPDALRENWNHYCETGELKFVPRLDGGVW